MSVLRRILLLLCVSVLLREGDSNSPFDFFRDIKNRIFASDNSTDLEEPSEPSNSTLSEEPPTKCLGLDQDGVCTGVNGTQDGSVESFNQSELTNGTQSSDVEDTTDDQLTWNETVAEDTNITDNTQEWNSTANNSTDNSTNDFEFSENEQNGTDYNNETLAENEEVNNQTENTRSKRQINKLEVNSSLNTTETILKPQMINTTGFTGQAGNFSNNSILANNTKDSKENISNATINKVNVNQNESITANESIDENQTFLPFGIPGNNTEEIINNQDTYESSNTTTDSSEDIAVESSNTISETNGGESILKNCTDCVAMKEDASFKNNSLDLNNSVNLTEFKDQEKIGENTTQVNTSSISGPTNITMLKDILENSTRIIEKMVQNIVPAISELKNEIKAFTNNDTMLENIDTFDAGMTENQTNASEASNTNNTQINNEEIISNGLLNSTTSQLNMTNEKYINNTANLFDETLNMNNSDTIQSNALQLNLNDSIQLSNTTGQDGIKREKRSLNFTFLSESEEEEEFPPSTFPDPTESPETELLSNVITNSTEWNSRNETNEIEVVGPVCARRYEQCTNSSDCCEDYECIGADENNTTLHCDLRPQNLSLSTYLPVSDDDSVRLQ